MREIVLQTKKLSKRYKNFTAVDEVDMTVYRGDIYGFIGRNGAGKTTIMKIIMGLTEASGGEFEIFSKKGAAAAAQKMRIGCLIGNSLKHGAGGLVVSVYARDNAENAADAAVQVTAPSHTETDKTSSMEHTEQKHFVAIRFENALFDTHLDINRIFDEFYTTDISRTKGNTGLGLAIAKQFTEMLGGTISASYEEGRFAVTVEL